MSARQGAALVAEHEALMAQFTADVAAIMEDAEQSARLPPREHWARAQAEAARLLKGSSGGEDVVRQVLADMIADEFPDASGEATADTFEAIFDELHGDLSPRTLLHRAVLHPEAPPPPHTLADAWELYRQERLEGEQGRSGVNRLERVRRRTEGALGPLTSLPMHSLRLEHGRKLRDHMLAEKTSAGERLSVGTIRRELSMVTAIVELGLVEFDLQGTVANPFRKLDIKRERDAAPSVAREAREPLPESVLKGMRERLKTVRELALIWTMLEGTGCRGTEIIGLRLEDVRLDHSIPHINVEWHPDRRIKTAASHRLVPLVGDALEAAKEAMGLAARAGSPLLFPRYQRENGAEAVSRALNKHLRELTKNPKHVAYSLRHNLKARLMKVGTDARTEHRILGHAEGNLGDRVYGSAEAWLKVAAEAMEKAVKLRR